MYHRLGGLTTRIFLSNSFGDWKVKTKVLAGGFPVRLLREKGFYFFLASLSFNSHVLTIPTYSYVMY